MDATTTARTIAEPMGNIGMRYYFSKESAAKAEGLGLDAVLLYAGGRGGVIEGADGAKVDEVFYFFNPGFMSGFAERAWEQAGRETCVAAALEAADEYARGAFSDLDPELLSAFSEAVSALLATLPTGRWPIVDGYRAQPLPASTVELAYRHAILLRELRGGVHTDAVVAGGLDPKMSCRLDRDGAYFALHGYGDAADLTPTEADAELRRAVEANTEVRMAELLGGVSEAQREAIVAGSNALLAAIS